MIVDHSLCFVLRMRRPLFDKNHFCKLWEKSIHIFILPSSSYFFPPAVINRCLGCPIPRLFLYDIYIMWNLFAFWIGITHLKQDCEYWWLYVFASWCLTPLSTIFQLYRGEWLYVCIVFIDIGLIEVLFQMCYAYSEREQVPHYINIIQK
jgi:hypothetical protein